MSASAVMIEAPKVALSERDIVTILRIAKETATKTTNPVFCVRGPEVAEVFALAFPDRAAQIRRDFKTLQSLGTYRVLGAPSEDATSQGGSVRIFKRIDTLFQGSPVFPEGVPVAIYDRATQAVVGVSNKFNDTGSTSEINDEELKRVNAIAYDLAYLTPEQIRDDEFRKQSARNARVETDLDPTKRTAEILGPAIGAAVGEAVAKAIAATQLTPEVMARMLREAGFTVTQPPAAKAPEVVAKETASK